MVLRPRELVEPVSPRPEPVLPAQLPRLRKQLFVLEAELPPLMRLTVRLGVRPPHARVAVQLHQGFKPLEPLEQVEEEVDERPDGVLVGRLLLQKHGPLEAQVRMRLQLLPPLRRQLQAPRRPPKHLRPVVRVLAAKRPWQHRVFGVRQRKRVHVQLQKLAELLLL